MRNMWKCKLHADLKQAMTQIFNESHMALSQWEFDGPLYCNFLNFNFDLSDKSRMRFHAKRWARIVGNSQPGDQFEKHDRRAMLIAKQIPFSCCRKAKRLDTRRSRSLPSVIAKTGRFLTRDHEEHFIWRWSFKENPHRNNPEKIILLSSYSKISEPKFLFTRFLVLKIEKESMHFSQIAKYFVIKRML